MKDNFKKTEFSVEDKKISVYSCQKEDKPIIYLNTFGQREEQVLKDVEKAELPDFNLVVITGINWDRDLPPWDCKPVFRDGDYYTGGADKYLNLLVEKIVPEAEKHIIGNIKWRGLAGFSLAGLFTLYAAYQTDLFSRLACVSGSFWYPGFKDYAESHQLKRLPECIYFSIGDKEAKSGNAIIKTVQVNTEELERYYESLGIKTTFELNSGNHFQNSVERVVKGIKWILHH